MAARSSASALRVPVEDIATVSATVTTPDGHGGEVVGVILLSVAIAVVLTPWIIGRSLDSATHDCGANSGGIYTNMLTSAGVPLTTRPFDRARGCFAGDPVPTTDVWTASGIGGTSSASNRPGAHAPAP